MGERAIITGFATLYGSPCSPRLGSPALKGSLITLDRGCLSNSNGDMHEVKCLIDHCWGIALGSTADGSLRIRDSPKGLRFSLLLDIDHWLIGRFRDINGCSLGLVNVILSNDLPCRSLLSADIRELTIALHKEPANAGTKQYLRLST
jgi:phage head maturation protease